MFGGLFGAEVAGEVITLAIAVGSIVLGAGIALMSWTLLTVVKLTQMIGVLEERVRNLVDDIDELRAGNPEVRRTHN